MMRRTVPILLAALACSLAAVPAATAAVPFAAGPAAKLVACRPAVTAAGGTAEFVGRMPTVRGSARMSMRFDLLRSALPAGTYSAVALPQWSQWLTAARGRAAFMYRKRIEGLVGPAAYRVRVRFRWRDASGRVVRRAEKFSTACRQPDVRPNLKALRVTTTGSAAASAYVVRVRNAGRLAAGPSTLRIQLPDGTAVNGEVPALGARAVTNVRVPAARCAPGTQLQITVDATGQVAESDETDNTLTATCPARR